MQAVLSSGSSQCCPSLSLLGGRGMSWKTNCRHPTVLPHPTSAESFSAIAPYLLVRSTLLAFFFLSPVGHFGDDHCAQKSQECPAEEVADCGSCGPNADSSLNGPASRSRHVPVTDERFERKNEQTDRQTWAAERSSSRAGSESLRRRGNFGDM